MTLVFFIICSIIRLWIINCLLNVCMTVVCAFMIWIISKISSENFMFYSFITLYRSLRGKSNLAKFLSVHPFYSVSERRLARSPSPEMTNQSVFFGLKLAMIIKRFGKTARYQTHLHFLHLRFEWEFSILLKHEPIRLLRAIFWANEDLSAKEKEMWIKIFAVYWSMIRERRSYAGIRPAHHEWERFSESLLLFQPFDHFIDPIEYTNLRV